MEDDPSLGYVIKENLCLKGYDVTLCVDGLQGEAVFNTAVFNLCIVDVMLPGKDGFSLARSIRSGNSNVPILFLTAKSMTEDKLTGFQAGADDYITKPFSLEELLYRVEVFLKRGNVQTDTRGKIVPIGSLSI